MTELIRVNGPLPGQKFVQKTCFGLQHRYQSGQLYRQYLTFLDASEVGLEHPPV